MDVIEYRLCGRCDKWQAPENFGFRDKAQTRRQFWCLGCLVEYKHLWYLRHRDEHKEHVRVSTEKLNAANRARLREYKSEHPCVDCGETDPVVLEFDHVRGDKRWNISSMSWGNFPWATIEAELAKCEMRCANCHRRRTSVQRDGRWPMSSEDADTYLLGDNWLVRAVSSVDRALAF